MYSNETGQLGNVKEAKELLEYSRKLLNTIDDKDEQYEQMENYLISRLNFLK